MSEQTKLTDGIHWIGAVDWNARDFHSFTTERGTSYNAYLIQDAQTAVIDTVKEEFTGELLHRLRQLTDPSEVSYIVCNHAEPDHAGGLAQLVSACPLVTVVCSAKCRDFLGRFHDTSSWRFQVVKTGDKISLGRRTLEFIETPLLHWPDSMFTYVPEEKLLFSMDAFGQHYATSRRFDEQNPLPEVLDEAKIYYANIVMPFPKPVGSALARLDTLRPQTVAPSHGVIWRKHLPLIVQQHRAWSEFRPTRKALVIYDSMWQATERMAHAIAEGATSTPEVEVKVLSLRVTSLARLATEVLDAAAIAFGSATLNQNCMPSVAAALSYLKGLRPQNKAFLAFGATGWNRGGAEAIDETLRALNWESLREPLRILSNPSPDQLGECHAAGRLLAEKARTCAGTGATAL
jgi:flavorubredoxin